MSGDEAMMALAAYIRVRRMLAPGRDVDKVPDRLIGVPSLSELVKVVDGFVGADTEHGARGMALVAAAYRATGFEASLPSRNDPRHIDVPIKRSGVLVIGAEVKQLNTSEATADAVAQDAADLHVWRALLAVLRPGSLVDFDRSAVVRRAEKKHEVVLRVTLGARELFHEALVAGAIEVREFCATFPHAFAEALRDIRVADSTLETWAAIASRWE
jgi:hypothetical protein